MQVVSVGFAPVKGMRHTSYDQVVLDRHGPVGDRAFCLVDVERRTVLRTVTHRALLAVVAAWDGSVLDLELPDGRRASAPPVLTGEQVTCDYWGRSVTHELTDGPHAALLTSYLGKEVRLAASPRGGVVYGAPVSLLTTASLRELGERTGRSDLLDTAARFRMTMVVDAGDEPYAEDDWAGRELRVGEAVVRIRGPVGRCGVIDLDPTTGEKDGSLLKALSRYRPATDGEPWFGVDAEVVRPGAVRPTADPSETF
ncbi:MOSC domain-containing protein [Nocardioides sp. cx-173]|uniref:MOSC domain-containing protein n=1 Tax=Nocardioides sp. cx-173 TaxID=2898796 RepID=UPI001E3B7F17|nr:MOSC N-terminal beta barrel domain-containing protein [Nocardioides sp. cx-173]MCD4524069.1 MOSC domain-containing protein [Nocardioides sp. cx-173]UGB41470.1 MOSC domain-containing protein [Nocardioides sp. cx-173]